MTATATPKLRYHKPSGQYLVALPTTDGKTKYVYLGRDDKAAQLRYDALVVGIGLGSASSFAPSHKPSCSAESLALGSAILSA
jgi:hypothetical protein